jgi:hypothetical protein
LFFLAGPPLLHSERTQGFAADPDYWKGEVFAFVGSIQNLKDLKDLKFTPSAVLSTEGRVVGLWWAK